MPHPVAKVTPEEAPSDRRGSAIDNLKSAALTAALAGCAAIASTLLALILDRLSP